MPGPHQKTIVRFQEAILAYWSQCGRHELPWRRTQDPWKLLVAEVLLRKTTSTQALSVYDYFAELSPSDITATDVHELEACLLPLGIYQVRAAQLKQIALAVVAAGVDAYRSDEFLRSLPGVGRYISNSVRCYAFGIPAPALDANMIRAIQRVFSWKPKRKRAREDRELWAFAATLVPEGKCREFNWGVLDFAAAVCTHYRPKCADCSIAEICDYYQSWIDVQDAATS